MEQGQSSRGYVSSPGQRRPGYFVRRPRGEYEHPQNRGSLSQGGRAESRRRPRQQWVVKSDVDKQARDNVGIGEKRQKTTSVFERIEEQHGDSASSVGQSRR